MFGLSRTQDKTAVIQCPCGAVVTVSPGARRRCPTRCGAVLYLETDRRRADYAPIADVPDDYPYPGLPYLVRVL